MKNSNIKCLALCISFFAYNAITAIPQTISPKQIALVQNKYLRDKFVEEMTNDQYAYVPLYVKTTIKACIEKYPELKEMVDLSVFLDDIRHVTSREAVESVTHDFIALLKESNLKEMDPSDNTIAVMERYLSELESGSILTDLEIEPMSPDEYAKRSMNLFQCQTGIALSAGGLLNVYGSTNVTTYGDANIVSIGLPQNLNITGSLFLPGLTGPGAVTISATGQFGSAKATANGQLLLGVSGALPFFTGLSSPANPSGAASVLYASGANFLSLQSVPLFANVIRVDWLNGNNATATVTNGIPFQTITAAMNAISTSAIASIVNPIEVWVMPGIYNETVTMQQYVSLIGMSEGAGLTITSGGTFQTNIGTAGVTIQQINQSGGTNPLVNMAEYSRLENVNLIIDNSNAGGAAVTDCGIGLSGTMNATARIKSVTLNVYQAGSATNGTVFGVQNTGTGTPGPEIFALEDCTISVEADTVAIFYAVYNHLGTSGVGNLNINNCAISLTATGAPTGTPTYAGLTISQGAPSSTIINNTSITVTSSCSGSPAIDGILTVALSTGTLTINDCQISSSNSNTGLLFGTVLAGLTATINSSTITLSSTGTATSLTAVSGGKITLNSTPITVTCSNSGGTSTITPLTGAIVNTVITCNNSPITASSTVGGTLNGVTLTAQPSGSPSFTLNESPITLSSTSTPTIYGISNAPTSNSVFSTFTLNGSPINISSTSTATVYGIFNSSLGTGTTTCTLNSSPINATTTGSGLAYGVYHNGTTCTLTGSPITVSSGSGNVYGTYCAKGTINLFTSPVTASGTTSQVYGAYGTSVTGASSATIDQSSIVATSSNPGNTVTTSNYGIFSAYTSCTVESSPIKVTSVTGGVYGLYNTGASCIVNSSSITATTNGGGGSNGVFNSGTNCTLTACPIVAYSTGTTYGVINTAPNGTTTVNDSTIFGAFTGVATAGVASDISQTAGTIALTDTHLVTNTTNNLGFTASPTSYLTWGLQPGTNLGTIGASVNKYMQLGTSTVANLTNQTSQAGTALTATRPLIIRSLQVHSMTGPGGAITNTFTLYKNNGATSLATTLAGYIGASGISLGSVSFTGSDQINMVTTTSSSTGVAQGITVTAELY